MANKNYTTVLNTSLYLGKVTSGATTFTADQQTWCTTVIGAVESYIDRETRRAWNPAGVTVTNERYDLIQPVIYLKSHPVLAIQQVRVRTAAVGDATTILTANVDYELLDANLGQVNFASGYGDEEPGYWGYNGDESVSGENQDTNPFTGASYLAFVDYTANLTTVPADITLAATMITARTMALSLWPDRFGIDQAQADRDTSVHYTSNAVDLAIPDEAQRIIAGYQLPVFA